MTATYTRLRTGEWGIRVEGTVAPGATVTVAKRDGSRAAVTVARIIWEGEGIVICAIGAPARAARQSSGASRRGRGAWTGCACGSRDDDPRDSDCASCQHDY